MRDSAKMAQIKNTKSDKINLIDQQIYEEIQHTAKPGKSKGTERKIRIRNAKYKRTRISYSLYDFVVVKPKQTRESKISRLKAAKMKQVHGARHMKSKTKRRKAHDHEVKKRLSRLKKSILRFRQIKQEALLNNIIGTMGSINLNNDGGDDGMEAAREVKPVQGPDNGNQKLPVLHSRRYRNYCNTCTTKPLCAAVESLLAQLIEFQRRAYIVNEIKARAHRRYVIGFRQSLSELQVNKVKMLVIAVDCEPDNSEGGLDALIAQLKQKCLELEVPCVFALPRHKLSRILKVKKALVGCLAILNYDGAEQNFQATMRAYQDAKDLYTSWAMKLSQQQ